MIYTDPFENEWKTEPFAEKFLQQLQLEPKVTVSSANARKSFEKNNTDRNVPDLSNIATSLECLSNEDIYVNKTQIPITTKDDHTYTKKSNKYDLQIEEELTKMFDDDSPTISFPGVKKIRKTKRRQSLKNRLVDLFGSSLKDVAITKKKSEVATIVLNKRRHTLPISINIADDEILKPLQLKKKRKSEADIITTTSKIPKIGDVFHIKEKEHQTRTEIVVKAVEHKLQEKKQLEVKAKSCKIQEIQTSKSDELPTVNFTTVPNLVIPTIFTAIAKEIFSEDLKLATISDKPIADMSETITPCIDLTNDETFDDGTSVKEFNGIRIEIRKEIKTEDEGASKPSEQANVPVSNASISMPFLSPASPAKPTQGEAVLPQGTTPVQPEGTDVMDSVQKPPPMKKQKRQNKAQSRQLKFKIHDTPNQKEPTATEIVLQQHHQQQVTTDFGNTLLNLSHLVGFGSQQNTFPMNLTVNQQNLNRTQNNLLNSFPTNPFDQQNRNLQMSNNLQTQTNWYASVHSDFQSPPNVSINKSMSLQTTPLQSQARRILPTSAPGQHPITAFQASIGHQQQKTSTLTENQSLTSLTQQQMMSFQKASCQQSTHSMFLQNQQQQNAQQAQKLQQCQQLMSQNAQQTQQQQQMLMSQNVQQAQKLQQRRVSSSRQPQTSLNKQQLPNYSLNQLPTYLPSHNSSSVTNQNPSQQQTLAQQIWSQHVTTYLQEQKQQQQNVSISNQQQQLSKSLQNQKSVSLSNFNSNLGRQTIVSPPYSQTSLNQCTPQLLRLLKCSNPNSDYYPISNSVCADKIFPHVNNFTKYVDSVNKFARSTVGLFTESELKMERESFGEYIKNTMLVLGKRMIRDLSTVTVVHFDIEEILKSLSTKLTDCNSSQVVTVNRVCFLLHKLLGQADEFCTTPFLKKFLSIIRICYIKFQERPIMTTPSITSEQLRILEIQVSQYRSINMWLTLKEKQQQNQVQNKTSTSNSNQSEQSKTNESINQLFSQINSFLETGTSRNCDKRNDRVEKNNLSNTTTVPQIVLENETNNTVPESANDRAQDRIENSSPSTSETSRNTPECSPIITSTTGDSGIINIDDEDSMEHTIKQEVQIKKESMKKESRIEIGDDVIDLTWIEECTDGDNDILEEIIECKPFSLKVEGDTEENEEELVVVREVVSPADSGLGSPTAQSNDDYKCLCGNRAVYICRCNTSMYCSSDCQSKDWSDHQKLCHRQQT